MADKGEEVWGSARVKPDQRPWLVGAVRWELSWRAVPTRN